MSQEPHPRLRISQQTPRGMVQIEETNRTCLTQTGAKVSSIWKATEIWTRGTVARGSPQRCVGPPILGEGGVLPLFPPLCSGRGNVVRPFWHFRMSTPYECYKFLSVWFLFCTVRLGRRCAFSIYRYIYIYIYIYYKRARRICEWMAEGPVFIFL